MNPLAPWNQNGLTCKVGPLITGLILAICYPSDTRCDQGEAFERVEPGRKLSFPADHGSHPGFKIEWWYVTGHLRDRQKKRRFGYQATFFRFAGAEQPPSIQPSESDSGDWFLAHMALSDLQNKRFLHQERLNRSPLASATPNHLALRHGNWTFERTEDSQGECFKLKGTILSEAAFEFDLRPSKPITLFGDQGYSKKGEGPNAASYYMTFTRMKTSGTLQCAERNLSVEGESWMDHEVSSNQLGEGQVGWDWISIRFHNGRDLMAYRMRTEAGKADPASTLAWVDPEGTLTQQALSDDMWQPVRFWRSPETLITYPVEWELHLPSSKGSAKESYRVVPLFDGQEMIGRISGVTYWEGACEIRDASNQVVGEAYMELAGYDGHRLSEALNAEARLPEAE